MNPIQSFKLSHQGRIASAVTMALVLPLLSVNTLANTNNIAPIGDTSVNQVNNVDVVNIANPNSQGLSHNQYNQFNVNEAGAVLNNSLQAGESQLAGELEANPNLSNNASIILNEVVSKNPSLLLGQQEVFGMAADYVLANPNGISGENIGFINTNRASLVVGTPDIADERLAGFTVGDHKSRTLTLNGDVDGEQRLDLLAPKVDINGDITANEAINVLTGRNRVDYDSLQTSELKGLQPLVTLDGQILGSMQAGRIRLHNTDSDATQTLQGSFTADSEFEATADNLNVVSSTISNRSTANNDGTISLTGNNSLYVGGYVDTVRVDGEVTEQDLNDGVTHTHSSYKETQNYTGSQVTGDSISFAGSNVTVEGSQLAGKFINASGDTVNVSGVTTTNTTSSTDRNSKGLWFNENEQLTKSQQIHQSNLDASDTVTLNAEDLTIAGTTINGGHVTLTAENQLTATDQTTENSTSAINRYARETADLKTGSRTITDAKQSSYQTAITGNNVSISSEGGQHLQGVDIDATTATLNSAKDLTIAASSTANRQTDEEDFKYWGGIGGGETHINNKSQTMLTGSEVNADNISLSSDANISVTASQISANNNTDITATGDVNLTHDMASNQEYIEDRHGTAFNITDQKQAVDRQANTVVSASISGDNVTLTGDNIAITGSQVAAADTLEAKAQSTLTTDIANATDITKTEAYDLKSESDVAVDIDFSGEIASASDVVALIGSLDTMTINASGSLKGVNTVTTKGTGSSVENSLQATNANLSGAEVDLKGSSISAIQNATISGDQVTIGAGEALTAVDSDVFKSTGPEAYIRGGATGIEVGVSIGTDQVISEHNEYEAINTTIDTGNRADISANETLTNQGTQILADQIDFTAQDIVNDASYDRTVERNVVAGGDAALQGVFGTSRLVGGAINLSGQGIGETTEVKTAHTTDINATNDVSIAAVNSAVDAGTSILAKNINISADNYTGTAAYDSDITITHKGSGNVNVNAGTNDLINVDVAVGGRGDYQYQQTGTADAIKGSLTAETVAINSGTRAIAAQNVDADSYTITAGEEARIGQDEDKQWNTVGGAELGGSAGLTINTAAAATGVVVGVPSISGKAGFDYLGVEDSQAKAANVKADQLTVTADELAQIDGATVESGNITITGNQANILAAQDKHHAVGVSMGGSAGFSLNLLQGGGASTDDLGIAAKLGVINETSNKAHGATINTGDLTVTANDADNALIIEGADITASNVNLANTGDVSVIAAESKDYVGNFGIGGDLTLSADAENVEMTDPALYLNIETDDSSYYTLSSLHADTASISSDHDVTIQGNVNAGTLNAVAGNDLNIISAQDDITKVDITTELDVDGSPITLADGASTDDVLNLIKNDFNDGTILGVSVAGRAGFNIDDQKLTHQATVKADNFNASVGSQDIHVSAANVKANSSNLNGAQVNTTNNDDYVHVVGIDISGQTFSIPDFAQSIPTLIKDTLSGQEVEVDLPVDIDVNYEWDDIDGTNTQSDVDL